MWSDAVDEMLRRRSAHRFHMPYAVCHISYFISHMAYGVCVLLSLHLASFQTRAQVPNAVTIPNPVVLPNLRDAPYSLWVMPSQSIRRLIGFSNRISKS